MKNYVQNLFRFLALLFALQIFNSCHNDSVEENSQEVISSESDLELVQDEGFLANFDEIDSSKTYTIQGENGMYVSSENGRSSITCNRSQVGPWEEFGLEVISAGTSEVAIIGNKGKYLTYDADAGNFTFDADTVEDAQSFVVLEYTYGQSDLFYGNWYNTIHPVEEFYNIWAIDTDTEDLSIRTGNAGFTYEYGEFRIESVD